MHDLRSPFASTANLVLPSPTVRPFNSAYHAHAMDETPLRTATYPTFEVVL